MPCDDAHEPIDDNRIDEPEFDDAFNDLRNLAVGVNARITRIRTKAVEGNALYFV